MDYDKLIDAVKLCGSTPKVDQCKQCAYWSDGDMGKCIPKMTADAATALKALWAELSQMAACVYYKPGGLCRYGGDDPANVCVLGPCPHERTAEEVLADLARVTAERDAAVEDISSVLANAEEIRRGYGVDNADADAAFANLCGNYCAKCGNNCYKEAEDYRCKNFEWRGI